MGYLMNGSICTREPRHKSGPHPVAYLISELYERGILTMPERSMTCPHCRSTSYNPVDMEAEYCAHCRSFLEEE